MDKRTITFVLLVSAMFLGFNIYFSRQRDAHNRELLKQKEAKATKERLEKQVALQSKTATRSKLPIQELYLTPEDPAPITYGLNVDGNTLTLAWSKNLPETLFAQEKALTLVTEEAVKGGPVVYASQDFETLEIATLPSVGTFPVQLITFPADREPEIYYGELKQGELNVPLAPLAANALVVYESERGWEPIGYYNDRESLFVELQNLPLLSNIVKPRLAVSMPERGETEAKYYVLENAYQQLVFSNIGGALVEINLPFHSEEDPESVVNEIGFDRKIAKQSPANARFPAHPYYTPVSSEQHPPGQVGGYYPLLRRGIWNGKPKAIAPQYYAMNIVSDYPEMAELHYTVQEFTDSKIVFEARQPHRRITKTFTLVDNPEGVPYAFDLKIQVEGDSRGLWLSSGVPEVEIMSNRSAPMIQYRLTRKGKGEVEKIKLPKDKETVTVSSVYPDWVVDSNGYLGVITNPVTETTSGFRVVAIPGTRVPTRLSVIDPKHTPYPAVKYPGYQTLMPIPATGGTFDFRVFAGPFEESILKRVDKIITNETGVNPDYRSCRTFYGWFSFISKPFSKLLFIVMSFFHTITGSWGISIILLTVFLRLLLYPLNAWSIKSMRRMQKLSPKIQAIQAKYKKEPKKAQIEIMTLYREHKVNPFMGCLPIIIQIPFLIAMFDLLKSSFQLRGAVFIPGWITNLTAPDVLFQWSTPIFFIGNQFHLLPILLGGVMFLQQRISSTAPKDPSKMSDQQRQQRTMGTIMTVVFMVMFYHFPSGLNLYWLSSMSLGIFQTWITNRILDKQDAKPEVIVPPRKNGRKKVS